MKKTYLVTIREKRFLRKPLIDTVQGNWESEDEIRRIITKFRPKAEILRIQEIKIISEWIKRDERIRGTEKGI